MGGETNATNEYHLMTEWWFEGTAEEIYDVLSDTDAMRRWWRAFIIDLDEAEPGDDTGVGKVVRLHVKGWLPYELRWQFRVREANRPHGFSIEAWGDLNGRGRWTLTQEGPWVHVHYDWRVSADKWYLRYFSFALKPLFASNHRWAMQRGEEGIKLELARRAATPAERDAIPLPPMPATKVPMPLIAGMVIVVGLFIFLRRRAKRNGEEKAAGGRR
jgi:Polyketide cyclase / dehydrase and lipid transport